MSTPTENSINVYSLRSTRARCKGNGAYEIYYLCRKKSKRSGVTVKAEPIVDENNNQVVTNDNAAAVGSENEEAPIYRLRLRSNQQNGMQMSALSSSITIKDEPTVLMPPPPPGIAKNYFNKGIKIKNSSDACKSLLFNQTITLDESNASSIKSVVRNSAATPSTRKSIVGRRQAPADQDYTMDVLSSSDSSATISDDDVSEMSVATSTTSTATSKSTQKKVVKKTNASIARLKNENMPLSPNLPTNKRKSGVGLQRRNTISSTTPNMQKRLFSKVDTNALSVYEKARMKLHLANTPDCLPCRDKQFSDIFNFIETNLKNQTGGCMYICGVPGTGKTLTTKQVIACLKESASDRIVPKFRFIDVNAFQVTEPHQIYKLIYKELTDESVSAENAVMLLEKKFESKTSEPIVLLVDELDMLCTKKQDVLYNIFDWPYKKNSKWIVVAIANAMNLPEQVMSKIASRLGMSRLIFQPYSHAELEEIVTLRLHELNVFDADAITFAARKVAAVSGDARRALEICRRATELAERDNAASDNTKKLARINGNSSHTLSARESTTLVSIGHVDTAIRSMFSSAKITALKNASRMEQLFMKAIACLYQASGIEETSLNKIYEQHTFLCRSQGMQSLNRTQFMSVCCSLASTKLVLLEPSNNIYLQRVRCNMSTDDIDYVLNNNSSSNAK